jgi:hypothetical protein
MSESNTSSNPDIRPDADPTDPGQEVLGGPQGDTTRKDAEEWVTGDEPMTGAQRSYLDTLAREAGEQLPADLTKAEASEHIDRLQSASDRTG